MRLIVKNGEKTNGADTTLTADPMVNGVPAGDWTNRPSLASVLRAIDGGASEVKEALLQMLNGVMPYVPRIRVRETHEAIVVTARLPDVDEDSVEVTLTERALHIRGEKSRQRERTRRAYRSIRKVYRTFERMIPVNCNVDRQNVVATLRDGRLRINVPRKHPSVEESGHFASEWVGVA